MSMYFSIYRIHTDKGTYVGHHRPKSRTLYLDGSHELEKKLRFDRHLDDKITLDMKYQFDLMMITHKMLKMTL
jgi:aromatic ring-opening dioxygenase LigB subunit